MVGDATTPEKTPNETVIIAHVVNDAGAWGRGFVVALSRWDDGPERRYRRWHQVGCTVAPSADKLAVSHHPFELGRLQVTPFGPSEDRLWVANMVAQRGWRRGGDDPQALDPEALRSCLGGLRGVVTQPYLPGWRHDPNVRVVMPRIGCGLGGGRWADVEPVIREELVDHGVNVTVYSLPGERWDD